MWQHWDFTCKRIKCRFLEKPPRIICPRIICRTLRFVASTVCGTTACRFYSFMLTLFVTFEELQLRYLEFLYHLPIDLVTDELFFKWYSSFQVAERIYKWVASSLIFLLMGEGFLIFVVCNITTIKGYYVLPIEMYWLAPIIVPGCQLFVLFLFDSFYLWEFSCIVKVDNWFLKDGELYVGTATLGGTGWKK